MGKYYIYITIKRQPFAMNANRFVDCIYAVLPTDRDLNCKMFHCMLIPIERCMKWRRNGAFISHAVEYIYMQRPQQHPKSHRYVHKEKSKCVRFVLDRVCVCVYVRTAQIAKLHTSIDIFTDERHSSSYFTYFAMDKTGTRYIYTKAKKRASQCIQL